MKEYRVKKEIAPHLIFVLERDKVPYQYYCPEGETHFLFLVDANSRYFKILMEDAYCEEQRHRHVSCIPVYSARTLRNTDKLKRLKKLNGKTGFVLLRRDAKQFA